MLVSEKPVLFGTIGRRGAVEERTVTEHRKGTNMYQESSRSEGRDVERAVGGVQNSGKDGKDGEKGDRVEKKIENRKLENKTK